MSKVIALVYDVDTRRLMGASEKPEDAGFVRMTVPPGHSIVVTCEGSFSWRCIPTDEANELPPEGKSGE